MRYSYKPSGVCAMQINFDIDGDVISNVEFIGGCNGNLKALHRKQAARKYLRIQANLLC